MDKVISVGVEMFFSILTDIEKYFGFVSSENNKLFFEVDFIECLLVFALLVWVEGCWHGGYGFRMVLSLIIDRYLNGFVRLFYSQKVD